MLRGWKYIKWGHCGECDNEDARLYAPILLATTHTDETTGKEVLRGSHLVLFAPICTTCTEKYDVHQLCSKCLRPMRRNDESPAQELYECMTCPKGTAFVGLICHSQ